MMKGKGIIEEAKETIIGAKDAAKEKVHNATETVKKVIHEVAEGMDPSKRIEKEKKEKIREFAEDTKEQTKDTVRGAEEIAKQINEKAQKSAHQPTDGGYEGAREKLQSSKKEDLKPVNENERLQKGRFYKYQSSPSSSMVAPSLITLIEGAFETRTSTRAIPDICFILKKILK